MKKRAELEWIEPLSPMIGGAEAVASDEKHSGHGFLYVPDLSSQTGWSAHRVPERQEKHERREMGFRR